MKRLAIISAACIVAFSAMAQPSGPGAISRYEIDPDDRAPITGYTLPDVLVCNDGKAVRKVAPAKIQNIYSTLIDGHAKSVQTRKLLTADDAIHNLALCAAAHESAKKGGKIVAVKD